MNGWDREREQVERDYAEGLISNAEYWRLIREINRDEQAAAQEAAQEAYDREMDDRGFGRF